jgi:anti-anti-sigma regulatory factor
LEGEIDITVAAELKKLLLQAMASGTDLRVDLDTATGLDVTALQLLWAAQREAGDSGVEITLAGQVPENISVAVADAGFEKFPVAASRKEVIGV